MTIAWVVGRGGLLGSALERALTGSGTRVFVPLKPMPWRDSTALLHDLQREVLRFVDAVRVDEPWEIFWAAGVGTMGSQAAALAVETTALNRLLELLNVSGLPSNRGRFALASSAGAIYAGSTDPVISEQSLERPTTEYARAKLEQERLVRVDAERSDLTVLIGRISTLYGVGQASEKQQGLLTHISRCVIRNDPVNIFVPLDTIRDYIGADDAAAAMVESVRSIQSGKVVIKIIASERPSTISEILGIFKRLARRPPRIVTSGAPTSSAYSRRIQFRSVVPPARLRQPVNLLIGISQILAAERLRYAAADPFRQESRNA